MIRDNIKIFIKMKKTKIKKPIIAVIGLGYVGLPLAIEFAKKYKTIGYDTSDKKIENLIKYNDKNRVVRNIELKRAIINNYLEITNNPSKLKVADYIIIAVPTPIDDSCSPDLSHLIAASKAAGSNLKKGATVIYESTVYPGATEEICVPVLEELSGKRWLYDFFVGYSPERINPGDNQHTLTNIVKVVSGDSNSTLQKISELYESIISAGIYRAKSIKVAEAAKVIENTQRDLNIALINELALIFDRLKINTTEVLNAAGTKWNFLNFKPGLVGGHCIGVDPYYLTHKAEKIGYQPQVILAGRRINNGMGKFIAEKTIKMMINNGVKIKESIVVVLGLTFKEDCPDIRNSKVIDIISELKQYGCNVIVNDPIASKSESRSYYGITLTDWDKLPKNATAIVIAVAHQYYKKIDKEKLTKHKMANNGVLVDVKNIYNGEIDKNYWCL